MRESKKSEGGAFKAPPPGSCRVKGHSMSNHPMVETVPPPDFDENLHIWSIWSEKKICQIIAYLVKYFPRYGPLKFAKTDKIGPPAP